MSRASWENWTIHDFMMAYCENVYDKTRIVDFCTHLILRAMCHVLRGKLHDIWFLWWHTNKKNSRYSKTTQRYLHTNAWQTVQTHCWIAINLRNRRKRGVSIGKILSAFRATRLVHLSTQILLLIAEPGNIMGMRPSERHHERQRQSCATPTSWDHISSKISLQSCACLYCNHELLSLQLTTGGDAGFRSTRHNAGSTRVTSTGTETALCKSSTLPILFHMTTAVCIARNSISGTGGYNSPAVGSWKAVCFS